MRIAVIADTHDKLPEHVLSALAHGDEIWHLGDVVDPAVLDSIRAHGKPLRVVRGNCDYSSGWPLELSFALEGFAIHLVHIPPSKAPPGVDLLLHGHTHVPRDQVAGKTRFLNPGCITRPNRGAPASYAWLELIQGQPPSWHLKLV